MDKKKKHSVFVDPDGNKVMVTDQDDKEGRASPTNLTERSEEACCKICWGTEAEDLADMQEGDEPNPLISPCKCQGTAGTIHLKCLRSWLETKRQRKVHKGQVMLKFNKTDCEICKQVLPFKIAYRNQIVDIVGVEKPQKNFIILESLNSDEKKVFHIINTEELANPGASNKTKIKIGRGQDSEVRIVDDISVSRNHAFIHRDANGHYYLTDNGSKFGTLMQLQYPVFLAAKAFQNNSGPLTIQSGKSLLSFRVRKTQSCTESYACLRACMSCFKRRGNQQVSNLITLDGISMFPKEFLDLKAFHSNKAQAINDSESSVE